jgi:tetratricopeptide (TPR) repeat protein
MVLQRMNYTIDHWLMLQGALRKWDEALVDYGRAVQLAPEFSFAAANYALALYQVGRENEAFKQFRSILRKYPEVLSPFPFSSITFHIRLIVQKYRMLPSCC